MGNQIARRISGPSNAKRTERRSDGGIRCAVSSMRGWRPTMEDEHIIHLNWIKDHHLFCVFDGHGGANVSAFLKQHFVEAFLTEMLEYIALGEPLRAEVPGTTALQEGLRRCFIRLDEAMWKQHVRGGSTAVCVVLSPHHIVTANVGDSRALLRRHGQCIPLSFDHKPYTLVEKRRILAHGMTVRHKRVNGDLAVSRALGDFTHKPGVSCIPDITIFPRDADGDEFIVLACDGVFDVATNQECCEFVQKMFAGGESNLGCICEEAIETVVYDRKSRDNVTLVLVALPGAQIDTQDQGLTASWSFRTNREATKIIRKTQEAAEELIGNALSVY
jgi:serine/threonine protein phosphatase PrpC